MDGRLHRLLISYLPVSVNDFLWVVFFLGAYVTAGTKGLEVLHYTLGYSMSALIIIRIFFGLADKGYTNIIEWFQDPVEFISDLRTRLKLELNRPGNLRHFPASRNTAFHILPVTSRHLHCDVFLGCKTFRCNQRRLASQGSV
jgi:hypothetical protein